MISLIAAAMQQLRDDWSRTRSWFGVQLHDDWNRLRIYVRGGFR